MTIDIRINRKIKPKPRKPRRPRGLNDRIMFKLRVSPERHQAIYDFARATDSNMTAVLLDGADALMAATEFAASYRKRAGG